MYWYTSLPVSFTYLPATYTLPGTHTPRLPHRLHTPTTPLPHSLHGLAHHTAHPPLHSSTYTHTACDAPARGRRVKTEHLFASALLAHLLTLFTPTLHRAAFPYALRCTSYGRVRRALPPLPPPHTYFPHMLTPPTALAPNILQFSTRIWDGASRQRVHRALFSSHRDSDTLRYPLQHTAPLRRATAGRLAHRTLSWKVTVSSRGGVVAVWTSMMPRARRR